MKGGGGGERGEKCYIEWSHENHMTYPYRDNGRSWTARITGWSEWERNIIKIIRTEETVWHTCGWASVRQDDLGCTHFDQHQLCKIE